MAMYEKQQQLVDQVTDQMNICADMLGELNEVESEEKLRERIKNVAQGIFQVMFTGTFNAGKSTILNALMRSDVLATGNLPETAVITKIVFKSDDECAIIYKKELDDKGQPKTIVMKNLSQFFDEYHVDREDTEKFRKIVDHVVIHQKGSGIAGSMVQLVDSPGTRASEADDEVALAYAEKADALVFMISALEPLDKNDRAYIAKHFAGKQKENVFFVVNKINLLNSDEEIQKLKAYVQDELKAVFTDKKGVFNKELFDERVFYVDAYGAMNTRLGRETPITRNYKVMIPEEQTYMTGFEESLAAYLGSGDSDKKALAAYRSQMADFYMVAENSMRQQLELLSKGKDEIEKELEAFKKDEEKISIEIDAISNDIETAKKDILRDARDVYDNYLDAVESDWKDYFSDKSGDMGVHTVQLLLAKAEYLASLWRDKETREAILKEKSDNATKDFQNGIRDFMELKATELSDQLSIKVEARLNKLAEDLNRHQENLENMNLPIDVSQVVENIIRDNHVVVPEGGNNANLGQALVALLFADPELIVTAGTGRAGTVDFIIDVIKTNIIDLIISYCVTAVVGNIVGIIVFIIIKLCKAAVRDDDFTTKLIEQTMNAIINGDTDKEGNVIEGLRHEGKIKYVSSTESKIGGAMLRADTVLTDGIKARLATIKRQLEDMYKKLSDTEDIYSQEEKRMSTVLNTFAEAVSKMSVLTTGEALTVDEIKKLGSAGIE